MIPAKRAIATTEVATSMEIRVPKMTRERISRPNSSVPNQWVAEGPSRRACRWMAAGSKGAIQGAKMASAANIANKIKPKIVSGWERSACIQTIVIERGEDATKAGVSRKALTAFDHAIGTRAALCRMVL